MHGMEYLMMLIGYWVGGIVIGILIAILIDKIKEKYFG